MNPSDPTSESKTNTPMTSRKLAEHLLGSILNYDISLPMVQDTEVHEFAAAIDAQFSLHLSALTQQGQDHLGKLVADMRSIKDGANEMGAGDPPDGYTELEDTKVADACWQNGLNCMETAVLNWVHDQKADAARLNTEIKTK